jgi:hypothetical protein
MIISTINRIIKIPEKKSALAFPKKNLPSIFAPALSDGVMVAQQILVLFV